MVLEYVFRGSFPCTCITAGLTPNLRLTYLKMKKKLKVILFFDNLRYLSMKYYVLGIYKNHLAKAILTDRIGASCDNE